VKDSRGNGTGRRRSGSVLITALESASDSILPLAEAAAEEAGGGYFSEDGERGVGGDGHVEDDPMAAAVFGDVGDSVADGGRGAVNGDGGAAE